MTSKQERQQFVAVKLREIMEQEQGKLTAECTAEQERINAKYKAQRAKIKAKEKEIEELAAKLRKELSADVEALREYQEGKENPKFSYSHNGYDRDITVNLGGRRGFGKYSWETSIPEITAANVLQRLVEYRETKNKAVQQVVVNGMKLIAGATEDELRKFMEM